jgi:phosphoglycerate dehydrogenase-like enzyme
MSAEPIHVLLSARVTAAQIARMKAAHRRLVIHGEPGGYATVDPAEVDFRGIDYPEERPDVDVEALLAKAEVLIATRIPGDVTERAPRLEWIQVTSAGIDHLWKPCLDDSGITVTSAKGLHAIPMAEFVMACLLAFAKGLLRLAAQQGARRWEKFVIQELHGKTVVLIGVGAIGGAVGRAAKQAGMRVIGVRRRAGREGVAAEIDQVTTFDQVESALRRADYVVSSLPLTHRTRRLIGERAFRAMPPSAMFVNVGRGQTVDQDALVRALEEGWIAGAALDTFETEPLPETSPLWDLPNVLISPHMGADTPLYMERMTDILCDNLKRYAEGRPLRNVIDPVERY